MQTKLKTKASRKGVPMDNLADLLQDWKAKTAYSAEDDWVFASPHRNGEMPLNPVPAMTYWIQPAAQKAGITKHFNWHIFRHLVGSLLGQSGEHTKVVQRFCATQTAESLRTSTCSRSDREAYSVESLLRAASSSGKRSLKYRLKDQRLPGTSGAFLCC